MKYFIAFEGGNKWELKSEFFDEQLSLKWPNIEVFFHPNPSRLHSLSWELYEGSQNVSTGGLRRDKPVVSFQGTLEFIVDFAIWFRALVPEEQELLFFDESYSIHFPLTVGITKAQILEQFE